jgi:hypothetical protein
MDKTEVLAKYKAILQQALHVAQRARSFADEVDDFKNPQTGESIAPQGALYMRPVFESLDPKVFKDDDALNIPLHLNTILGKFEDDSVTTSDIQNAISLCHRSQIIRMGFELFGILYDYGEQKLPSVLETTHECMMAGVEL